MFAFSINYTCKMEELIEIRNSLLKSAKAKDIDEVMWVINDLDSYIFARNKEEEQTTDADR